MKVLKSGMELEPYTTIMAGMRIVRCAPDLDLFSRELTLAKHRFRVNRFYVKCQGEIYIESVHCCMYVKKEGSECIGCRWESEMLIAFTRVM